MATLTTEDDEKKKHSKAAFQKLGISPQLAESCADLGWKAPTSIQEEAVPHALEGTICFFTFTEKPFKLIIQNNYRKGHHWFSANRVWKNSCFCFANNACFTGKTVTVFRLHTITYKVIIFQVVTAMLIH